MEEWTVEANPATVRRDYCAMLRERGVDRLSFGAQSFDRAELATLERHHDPDDVAASLDAARAAGFERLNVDLIYAIPGQDLESWSASLERRHRAGDAAPLVLRPDVRAEHADGREEAAGALRAGRRRTLELEMLHHTRRRLAAAGYRAVRDQQLRAAGRGVPAQPRLLDRRQLRRAGAVGGVARRRLALAQPPAPGRVGDAPSPRATLPASDVEQLSPAQRAGELAMLMLRLAAGSSLTPLPPARGGDARAIFADQIDRLARVGLITSTTDAIRLTERGMDVADAVAAEFLRPLR